MSLSRNPETYRWMWICVNKSHFVLPVETDYIAQLYISNLSYTLEDYKAKKLNTEIYELTGANGSVIAVMLAKVNAFGLYPKGSTPYPGNEFPK